MTNSSDILMLMDGQKSIKNVIVIDELESIHNGKIGKVMFVKLKAKNNIIKHWDSTEYLNVVRRHHKIGRAHV